MTRPIRWEVIEQNYDRMIRYATAIKQGAASTEAILRRSTESASHPTYQAMLEVGRTRKTVFVARYLRLRELQREIQEGLNVVESSNGANSVISYGKGRRHRHQPARGTGDDRVVPAHPAGRTRLHQHNPSGVITAGGRASVRPTPERPG
jgi:TnpA family transposase